VFPFVKMSGWKLNPHLYRKVAGGSEVVCGVILVAIPGMSNMVILMECVTYIRKPIDHFLPGEF